VEVGHCAVLKLFRLESNEMFEIEAARVTVCPKQEFVVVRMLSERQLLYTCNATTRAKQAFNNMSS
jgi:hypothetical protein